ncbi:pilus assembly protein [Pseudoclavibacter sp. RFBJ3]|uniref:type II secretion system F family protein n=1 Tax=unclassified Pseudoclavibacter TaxID=2615177 RepID=UPI000CE89532|nr:MULTISPECIES: type II secretion system F family protein [unclassified Pseudoclavibacter]PPF85091.1 pilus assembly protein [Pseudoclavibacter sp. RFBJ5]PPF94094.1 pilus assembly protein [Pseudoclavibacter sp. RFBJ3]PPF98493.1 pilus assembly protein [Pseudoclavibacter sp. RFBH5]PPG24548.1 pilus assembly protein [Pseudoclavibacter sp. RFBI4]
MNETLGWAVLCGLGLGIGLWTLLAAVPRLSKPNLAERLAPHLLDISAAARADVQKTASDPLPILGTLAAPFAARGRALLDEVLGGSDRITAQLRQSGSTTQLERFRAEQLTWGLVAAGLGLSVGLLLGATRGIPVLAQILLPLLLGCVGIFLRDRALGRAAQRRHRRIASEFPTVVEFLSLSLSAGEGIFDSLKRVASVSTGELAKEFARVVHHVNTGVSLSDALHEMTRGVRYLPLDRCVEHMISALERGAPLVEVLRAQASDARELGKRDLLESAGRKEVQMLVPLIFLILPTTILFALYPAVFVLRTSF